MSVRPAKTQISLGSPPPHPPSLIRVFAVRMKKAWVLSYPLSAQRRLWSDWADAQADLSLRWAHTHFLWFWHVVAHIQLLFYGPAISWTWNCLLTFCSPGVGKGLSSCCFRFDVVQSVVWCCCPFPFGIMGRMWNSFVSVPFSFEPHRDKTNKMACAPSEDSDQPGHPPSLIRVFAVRSMSS